jgi:hypothetical protein
MSCGLGDSVNEIKTEMTQLREQSVLTLNDGINALQNTSADLKSTLKDMESRIDKRVQDAMTYNIPYITNLASQRLLSSVLCIKESAKDEAIYYLKVARAELITGVQPPLPSTKICLTSMPTVDLNAPRTVRTVMQYTGYYIHTPSAIKARLRKTSFFNGRIFYIGTALNIPASKIGFPDISNITVSLSEYSDEVLKGYTNLELLYNDEIISTINIVQKTPAPPVIETIRTYNQQIICIPRDNQSAEKDFGGRGPAMSANFHLMHDGFHVYAKLYVYAAETNGGRAYAEGQTPWIEIYTVKDGYKINRILDPTDYWQILGNYVDTSMEDFYMETSVGRAKIVGDTGGPEVGTRTGVTLQAKPFSVEIQKI